MEGRGVTNYATDKPAYSFTAATTEFDQELIKRGIVTREQAVIAKGASIEEAVRITTTAAAASAATASQEQNEKSTQKDDVEVASDSSDDEYLDDDDFLDRYRQQRINEIKQAHDQRIHFGEVVRIDRTEWKRHVNEDSERAWVVVCLTSSDTERTGNVEQAVKLLAREYPATKFVLIAHHSAIPNWPDENLPSLFLYRHGKMQKELISLQQDMTKEQLESLLRQYGVLDGN